MTRQGRENRKSACRDYCCSLHTISTHQSPKAPPARQLHLHVQAIPFPTLDCIQSTVRPVSLSYTKCIEDEKLNIELSQSATIKFL